jgi:hypothetical protein
VAYLIGFIVIFIILASLGVAVTKTKKSKQIASIVAAVIAGGTMLLFYHQSHENQSNNFVVVVRTYKQLPNQYVRVYLNVTNTGNSASEPTCSVSVDPTNSAGDPVGNGGVNAGTFSPAIEPGATSYTYLDVLVAGNDAGLVTSKSMISATCS